MFHKDVVFKGGIRPLFLSPVDIHLEFQLNTAPSDSCPAKIFYLYLHDTILSNEGLRSSKKLRLKVHHFETI